MKYYEKIYDKTKISEAYESRFKYYKYKGFKLTAADIADILKLKDEERPEFYSELDCTYSETEIDDIIIKYLSNKKELGKFCQESTTNVIEKDFNTEQYAYLKENLDVLDNFIRNREIVDEDIKQELYINFFTINVKRSKRFKERLYIAYEIKKMFIKLVGQELIEEYFIKDKHIDDDLLYDYSLTKYENTLFKLYDHKEMEILFNKILEILTPRERYVIECRFGFSGEEPKTLVKTGEAINISRGRVHQIEVKALRKLRYPSRVRYIRDYYDYLMSAYQYQIDIR